MSRANIQVALKGYTVTEGPHWIEKTEELLFVDIFGSTIYRYIPSTGDTFQVTLEGKTSMVVPVEASKNKYIYASDGNLNLLTWDGVSNKPTEITPIGSLEEKKGCTIAYNDGKCDPQGRLWIGTYGTELKGHVEHGDVNEKLKEGKLYKIDVHDQSLTSHVDNIAASNGLAWSPDSSKFYFIDTWAYSVDVFDFDADQGTLSNRRVLYDFKKNGTPGVPDGMTVDANGNCWVASFMGAKVLHIDSTTGQMIDAIDFKNHASSITSATFGGPNLDTLYVTSANFTFPQTVKNHVVTSEVNGGAVFKITNLGVKGIPNGNVGYKGKLTIL